VRILALLFTLGLLIGCLAVPVQVRNSQDNPVVTAPRAVMVEQEDGSVLINPQLGPPPTVEDVKPPEPNIGFGLLAGLLPSPWREILGILMGVLGGKAMMAGKANLADKLVSAIEVIRGSHPEVDKTLKAHTSEKDRTQIKKIKKISG